MRTTAILACGNLTYAISQTMMIPALPVIQIDFGATPASAGWVMSGFFISSAIFTGVIGRLGDMFGKRRMLLVTMAAYGGGALLCASAPTLLVLLIGRVIMGSGGGMVPLAYSIARDELPRAKVSAAIGTIAMMIGLGAGVGMVLGGVLVDHVGWHWSFLLAASLMATCGALAATFVPDSPVRSPARVDWRGVVLLSSGLGLLLFAVSRAAYWGWTAPRTLGIGAVGVVLLTVLLSVERCRDHPLIHVPTLVDRPVLFTNLTSMTMGAGQVAVSILVVQVAQVSVAGGGLDASATRAGLFIVPYSVTMVLGAQVAGRIAGRVGGRSILAAGAGVASAGLVGLAVAPVEPAFLWVFPAVSGLGISMTLVAGPYLLAESVERVRTGEANGINAISRAVGQAFGTQVSATVLAASVVAGSSAATADGYVVAFWFGAAACGSGMVAALLVPRAHRPGDPTLAPSVEVAAGIDAHGLAGRALAASEGDDLLGDVVPARGSAQ